MAAGFFSQAYVPGRIIVAGDVSATARNIVASEQLFRIGIAADALIFAADILMAVAFYVLLKKVNPGLALLALPWRTAQATIMAMNGLSFLTASSVLSGSDTAAALSSDQLQALANTYVGAHAAVSTSGLSSSRWETACSRICCSSRTTFPAPCPPGEFWRIR